MKKDEEKAFAIEISKTISEKMDELGARILDCSKDGEEESYYQGMFHALMRVKTWTWVLKEDEKGELVFSIDYVQEKLEDELSRVMQKLAEVRIKNAKNKSGRNK